MPDNSKVQNGVSTTSAVNPDKLGEAMWKLKIQTQEDHQDGVASHSIAYPDRPGEPDCIYYLRTGLCGYGTNCRFNHPDYSGQTAQPKGELPERVGEPDCQYFMKTGTCKFGSTCKYNHPRDRYDAGPIPLNVLGLPLRQEEKSCPFYIRTGSCKFGIACKFHHPQPASLGGVSPITGLPTYGFVGSSVAAPSSLPYVGGLPAWSLSRGQSISGPALQGPPSYMPVVLSSSEGLLPRQTGWNTYTGTMGPVSSTNFLGQNLIFASKNQGEPGSTGQLHSTSFPQYPERPEQPECQFYMKTGICKFGSTCKYHHPREKITPLATNSVGPLGLPLRPGQAVCSYYSLYGICKYGWNCKFDHPLAGGYYNYGLNIPSYSIANSPFIPKPRNSLVVCSSETSPSKSSKLPDMITSKQQNLDSEGSEDPKQEALSSTNTNPTCMEPRRDKSD